MGDEINFLFFVIQNGVERHPSCSHQRAGDGVQEAQYGHEAEGGADQGSGGQMSGRIGLQLVSLRLLRYLTSNIVNDDIKSQSIRWSHISIYSVQGVLSLWRPPLTAFSGYLTISHKCIKKSLVPSIWSIAWKLFFFFALHYGSKV